MDEVGSRAPFARPARRTDAATLASSLRSYERATNRVTA